MVHAHYRALHQIPERAFQEFETAKYLRENLQQMGYTPNDLGETGVCADLCVNPPAAMAGISCGY